MRCHITVIITLFSALFFPFACLANSNNVTPTLGASTALLVVDPLTSERLLDQHSDILLPPASTQKLLTALAAKQILGEAFRFRTAIHHEGQHALLAFSGDPTLQRTHIASLLRRGYQHNKQLFNGDIHLYRGDFAGPDRAPGITWDVLGVCYAAPAAAISLEDNCVQGALYANTGIGQRARLHVPAHHLITVDNNVTVVSKQQQEAAQCELLLEANSDNHYQLQGCVVERDTPLPLNFALQSPERYMQDVIYTELARLNIPFQGKVIISDHPPRSVALYQHLSAPLMTLLELVLQDSNNVLTDSLLRSMASTDGTMSQGAFVLRSHFADLFNDPGWLNVPLVDGSGLSRNNRLTAKQLMQVLSYVYQHEPALFALLPISGESGTLRYRQSVRHTPLKGALQAKTGSLYGAHNLAGELTTQSGRKLLVVQLVNGYFWQHQPGIESPLIRFERQFYQQLFEQY
ncbi:D-alanyl-D-alanine carboxypeptidase/D-alanyl-D-alanine-endopeptidase [Thaumasiovibrio sp. DFM-14]|uniref:D-alanyl-D-alanine carboxypeptidase/D-alanyl-D-alanine endopeptidase n=1 Tax=Thaumasiovibrio sp. DFM-14 TaxID=3384792 RepID=UPI0039A158AD